MRARLSSDVQVKQHAQQALHLAADGEEHECGHRHLLRMHTCNEQRPKQIRCGHSTHQP